MDTQQQVLSVYRELADRYEQLGQMSMRDRFLMLAADAALQSGQPAEAEKLRNRLLQVSRHHMLKAYPSFAEAVMASDVQTYLRDLRINYPLDVAQQLLSSLGAPGEEKQPALDQTQPINYLQQPEPLAPEQPATRPVQPIPPTAPLLNVNRSPFAPTSRTAVPGDLADPYPMREDTAAPTRPLSQPLPARPTTSKPPQVRPVSVPGARAATPVPSNPTASSVPPTSHPANERRPTTPRSPATPTPEPEPEATAGAWLGALLAGVVLVGGLALAAFTLARPFLPKEWLP